MKPQLSEDYKNDQMSEELVGSRDNMRTYEASPEFNDESNINKEQDMDEEIQN